VPLNGAVSIRAPTSDAASPARDKGCGLSSEPVLREASHNQGSEKECDKITQSPVQFQRFTAITINFEKLLSEVEMRHAY
jgi:hypothetical protein